MTDVRRVLDQLLTGGAATGFAGGLAGGALASMLSGKKGRKLAGSAVKMGGLALVGSLAYKAWQTHQQGASATPGAPNVTTGLSDMTPPSLPAAPENGQFLPRPGDEAGGTALSLLLVRAAIAAAKADGKITVDESQKILQQINTLELSEQDKAFLLEEYARPLDIQGLVDAVDTPEHAAEVYAASVLAVTPASVSEALYLRTLAGALELEAGLVTQIDQTVQAAIADAG